LLLRLKSLSLSLPLRLTSLSLPLMKIYVLSLRLKILSLRLKSLLASLKKRNDKQKCLSYFRQPNPSFFQTTSLPHFLQSNPMFVSISHINFLSSERWESHDINPSSHSGVASFIIGDTCIHSEEHEKVAIPSHGCVSSAVKFLTVQVSRHERFTHGCIYRLPCSDLDALIC